MFNRKRKNKSWIWLTIIIVGLIIVFFGNQSLTKLKITSSGSTDVDEQAKKDIYNVLWEKDVANWPANLPAELDSDTLAKITPKVFGEETATMLQDVKTRTLPLVQRYPKRYDYLANLAEKGLTNTQAYNIGNMMGEDYFAGYAGMKSIKDIVFPVDYSYHDDFQVSWYFFASSLTDQNGNYVDTLVNFFRRAIYPPDIAKKMGLSEVDNQMIELQLGLSLSDKNLHVQGSDPVVSGKTGLLDYSAEPFFVKVGKNEVKSTTPGSLFPMTVTAYDPAKDLRIELTLEETKPIFLEGDDGKVPSMYNLGTWYYSNSSIKTSGTITYQGEVRQVTGKTWFDNQWTAGIMPTGYPDNYYIRALSNTMDGFKHTTVDPWGWDWTEVQLDNNYDITLAAMHSVYTKDLQNLGATAPPTADREVNGKIIAPDGTAEAVTGTMQITDWIKSDVSGAWYPNRWEVEVPSKNLTYTMTPTTGNQIFQVAAASEFREGGVKVTGTMDGKNVTGVGFGEGTAYAGENYSTQTSFNILGIEDNQANRDLFTRPVPGWWLVTQSVMWYVISIIAAIWIIIWLYHIIFKRNK